MDQVVTWAGEIDIAQETALSAVTADALSTEGVSRLVFDLSAVTFIDSTGIGLLLDARNRVLQRGLQIVLRDVPDRVAHLLAMTGLADLFHVT